MLLCGLWQDLGHTYTFPPWLRRQFMPQHTFEKDTEGVVLLNYLQYDSPEMHLNSTICHNLPNVRFNEVCYPMFINNNFLQKLENTKTIRFWYDTMRVSEIWCDFRCCDGTTILWQLAKASNITNIEPWAERRFTIKMWRKLIVCGSFSLHFLYTHTESRKGIIPLGFSNSWGNLRLKSLHSIV